jgi:hypothetical protein
MRVKYFSRRVPVETRSPKLGRLLTHAVFFQSYSTQHLSSFRMRRAVIALRACEPVEGRCSCPFIP